MLLTDFHVVLLETIRFWFAMMLAQGRCSITPSRTTASFASTNFSCHFTKELEGPQAALFVFGLFCFLFCTLERPATHPPPIVYTENLHKSRLVILSVSCTTIQYCLRKQADALASRPVKRQRLSQHQVDQYFQKQAQLLDLAKPGTLCNSCQGVPRGAEAKPAEALHFENAVVGH